MGERLPTEGRVEEPVKHRLSVADFLRMAEVGILREDDRIELIEGELIDMAPIGSKHLSMVAVLSEMLTLAASGKAFIISQSPVILSEDSQPEPDLVLLKPRADHYSTALPTPSDVLLLIEVADTTLDYDRNTKIPLYARTGIPEVWLVNLKDNSIEVYREPSAAGYKLILRPAAEDSISPTQFSEFSLKPKDLFD
ncbi:MAG: Uma2 family endonuclease [Burkholderiales bacterium]